MALCRKSEILIMGWCLDLVGVNDGDEGLNLMGDKSQWKGGVHALGEGVWFVQSVSLGVLEMVGEGLGAGSAQSESL